MPDREVIGRTRNGNRNSSYKTFHPVRKLAGYFVSQAVPMKQNMLRKDRTAAMQKMAALQPRRRRRILRGRMLFIWR